MLAFKATLFSLAIFLSPLVFGLELREIAQKDAIQLRTEMPQLFSGPIQQWQVDDAIRFIMKNGNYEVVTFEATSNGDFVIIGRPLRVVEEIEIEGQAIFSKTKLIELLDIPIGSKFDRKRAIAGAERLKAYYGENGYFNTVINLSFPKSPNLNIILRLDIRENEPCRVATLEFNADNPILKRRLKYSVGRYLNRPLTENLIAQINKQTYDYFIDRRFLTAELVGPEIKYNDDKSKAFLSYQVKEPYRWEFFFEGNTFDSFLDIYRAMDWSNHERKNVEPGAEGAERIKRDYLAKGFPQVSVDFETEVDQPQFLKKVFYTINEGFRVRLKRLEIQGRVSRPAEYYSDFIINNSSDLIQRGYYNRQDLDLGFKNLVTELRNQGYLRARVQSSRIEYDFKKQNAVIIALVDEGPLTLIQSVDFDGNSYFSSFELTGLLGLSTNSPLKLTELEQGIERIKKFYHDQGFLEMKVLNEGEDIVTYNESGSLAHLTLKLYEGPRVRIASIRLEGNTFTKSYVIYDEADFHVGQILTPESIDNAIDRLNKLGLFSRVDVRTLEENTSVSERTLIISVTERDPGLFRFGAGVNNERELTARGFTSLSYNNLYGTARSISGRLQYTQNVAKINYPETDVTVSYLEPFLFDTRTRGRINLARSEHVFDYNSDIDQTMITTSNIVTFQLERDFTRHIRGVWRLWSRDERKDFERHGLVPTTVQYVSTVGPFLDFDYRDNAFVPSRGSFTRLSLLYSDPLIGSSDNINFYKAEASEAYYTRLKTDSNRWVWANQVKGGYLNNVSALFGSGVPVSNAFFLGGVDTIRGFDKSSDVERVPPGDKVPITSGNQILVKTDSYYYLIKSEFRFPISGEHGGVLFYDGGAVLLSDYTYDRPYRDAVGIGYRYITPVGPVSLDLAFKINPRGDPNKESPFRVHFSIGNF